MKIESVKIKDLNPATYNPRKLTDKQFADIKKSLKKFGFVDPIIVNKNNTIIGGHQRVKVWESLGNDAVPVFYVDLNDKDERELNVRLNKNSGEWDWDILANEFDIADLTDWGFDGDDFFGKVTQIEPEAVEDDYEVPDTIETDIVRGDIFEIGNHRLMCGDSTNPENIAKLMDGETAHLLLTDPPYGIDYGGMLKGKGDGKGGADKNGWKSYDAPDWDKSKPESGVLQYLCTITNCQIIWGGNYFTDDLPPTMGWLIWDKGQRGFSLADGEMAWTSFNNAMRIKEYSRAIANKEERNHPTQKPIEIIKWCFDYAERNSKIKSETILDPYLGSGSTMVASHQLNRKCYGMELAPKYCQVIVDRMKKLDPTLEIKRNGILI